MKKRQKEQLRSRIIGFCVAGIVIVAVVALYFVVRRHSFSKGPMSKVTPSQVATTAVPTATAVSTPTSIPTALATPITQPTANSLPTSDANLVKTFYAAYLGKDSKKLLSDLMVAPANDSERQVQSLLWKGVDLSGTAGGPTLFTSEIASSVVQSYTTTKIEQVGQYWHVSTHETVMVDGQKTTRDRILEITDSTTPLINRYFLSTSAGKYSGFLN